MDVGAAAVAAPGNIEGLVYLRPEFSLEAVLLVQAEIIIQGMAMSFLVALGLKRLWHAPDVVEANGRGQKALMNWTQAPSRGREPAEY